METFCIDTDLSFFSIIQKDDSWDNNTSRSVVVAEPEKPQNISKLLAKFHNRQIFELKFLKKVNLQNELTK